MPQSNIFRIGPGDPFFAGASKSHSVLLPESGRRQNEKEARTRNTVAEMKRTYPGVRGRVAELCKPKQKKYDEAITTAMGREFEYCNF